MTPLVFIFCFPVLPFAAKSFRAYSRLSIARIVPGVGVTSFRSASFLPACRRDADRNRGPGRVPGSPRNLSIRPTRSPPYRPPTYSFFGSSLSLFLPPPLSLFSLFYPSNSRVPLSCRLSILAPSILHRVPSSSSFRLFSSTRIFSTAPSTLFFHFCRCCLSLSFSLFFSLFSRFTGHTVAAFYPS